MYPLAENGERKRTRSGEQPKDRSIQRADITREEMEALFLDPEEAADSSRGRAGLEMLDTLPSPEYMEGGDLTPDLLRKMRRLIQTNTFESHTEASALLASSRFYAVNRWQDLHTREEEGHNFSSFDPALANPFAKEVFQWVPDEEGSRALEIGAGYGNDLVVMADQLRNTEFIGVDSSEAAIDEARLQLRQLGLDQRVQLVCGDYIHALESLKGQNLSMVYAHSALHYHPAKVLKHKIFPMIADVLRPTNPDQTPGKLLLGMKTAASASAQAPSHIQLLGNDKYHHCFDLQDSVFRMYLRRLKDALRLLHNHFDINEAYTQKVEGYDRKSDTEEFCYVVATARSEERST